MPRSGFAYIVPLLSAIEDDVLVKIYEEMSSLRGARSGCYRTTVLANCSLCKQESPGAMGPQEKDKKTQGTSGKRIGVTNGNCFLQSVLHVFLRGRGLSTR